MRADHHIFFLALLSLSSVWAVKPMPEDAGYGPHPVLPEPADSLIPTVQIAPARGWRADELPKAATGLRVKRFAQNLDHPRWLYVLPNGDVLVAETDAPPKPEDYKGLKGWFMKHTMKLAGAGGGSANRITLLRDTDGDGVADVQTVFLKDLHSPFGMALVGHDLYVANTNAVLRFPYRSGQTAISTQGETVVDLPAGDINHHWTKNIIASLDGSKLYVTIGSNSNVAENGLQAETERAAIWEIDLRTRTHRVFASGLRNPNGLGWEPQTHTLWTVVNERDELGSDLVPDFMTSVKDGAFYGWPFSYYGQHVDERVKPKRPDWVAKAIAPDYALGSHTACLGLAFSEGATLMPLRLAHGVLVSQHGSWNRMPRVGYRVIYIAFANGKPVGLPQEVLGGFIDEQGHARGRPVGLVINSLGALLVADDVGNIVWLVSKQI